MRKPDQETKRGIVITLILSAIYGITTLVTGQACSITYCQPKEPEDLHKFLKKKGVKNMKAIKKLMLKYGSSLAALALMIGVGSSSKACWWWYNQPKEPEGMKKFTKED